MGNEAGLQRQATAQTLGYHTLKKGTAKLDAPANAADALPRLQLSWPKPSWDNSAAGFTLDAQKLRREPVKHANLHTPSNDPVVFGVMDASTLFRIPREYGQRSFA